ncbi:MAG TPA: DNA alkylation repair protein [Euzebyales bacterium]|nr:DNA alkylation repair protein [Euzebyales bacterium]
MTGVAALPDDLVARLRPHAVPERAEGERRYLKSTLRHLGVPMPRLRSTTRAFLRDHDDLDTTARLRLVQQLWDRQVHELRRIAVLLLEDAADDLNADTLDLVERLARDAKTWALVDPLAIGVAGRIALCDDRVWQRTDRWVADDDVWVRRTALLAHLPALRTDRTRFEHFAGQADALLDDGEFFIRKAIGWVLREVARRDPAIVTAWLEPRTSRLSGLTIREAVRYLPAADRDRLLATHRRA